MGNAVQRAAIVTAQLPGGGQVHVKHQLLSLNVDTVSVDSVKKEVKEQ